MNISLTTLRKYEKMGLVKSAVNEDETLISFCYTPFAVQQKLWNDVTRNARGVVFDLEGNIVQHCIPKFFNLSEKEGYLECASRYIGIEDLFKNATAFTKLDGSLIKITKHSKCGLIITSKNSFNSEQVKMAKEILLNNPDWIDFLNENWTYCFELIHPENRIVVDYKNQKTLVLIDIYNEKGISAPIYYFQYLKCPFPKAEIIKNEDIEIYLVTKNIEGLVLNYDDLFKIKIKSEEYIANHRVVTNWNYSRVWEMLKNNESPPEDLPEEFENWLKTSIEEFKRDYQIIQEYIDNIYNLLKDFSDKEIGKMDFQDKHYIFALRRGRNISQMIWQEIKPKNNERILDVESNISERLACFRENNLGIEES